MSRKSKICLSLLIGGLAGSLAIPAAAQVRNQIYVGTRPHSMGDAFVAVADDGNAIQWNPAGMAWMEKIQVSFNYANLFGLGIDSYYASFLSRLYFIPPLTDYLTFGADWYRIGTGDDELVFTRDQIDLALGLKLPKNWPVLKGLGLGANAKYLNLGAKLDDNPEVDADGWGWDVGALYDFGAIWRPATGFRFGVMVHDVGGTKVKDKAEGAESSEVHSQNIRWGFSYRPFDNWPGGGVPISSPVLALDFDDRIHLGLEFWLADVLALRGGVQKDLHTDEKTTFSFGVGLRIKSKTTVNVDYAMTDSPVLPNTNSQFGGSLIFKNNPRLIRVEGAHIDHVFASLYPHYGLPESSIGTIKLKNASNELVKAWVTLEDNLYLVSATADTIEIAPKIPVHVPLRAAFKPEIINAARGRLDATVRVSYLYKGEEYATTASIDFELYERNFLTWDDPAKAAAWITYDDEQNLSRFVNTAESQYHLEESHWFMNYNMAKAFIVYHALKAYGIEYRRDPDYPFATLKEHKLDKILYPGQILRMQKREDRKGDCDDISVLFAGLLQNVHISTALVSQPTHLFMMFDTGIPESQRHSVPIPGSRFVPRNGSLWIPVDVAQINHLSFTGAWDQGLQRYRSGQVDSVYNVIESQKKYPPPPLRYRSALDPDIPDFSLALEQDLDSLTVLKTNYFLTFEEIILKEDLTVADKSRVQNLYGAVLGQNEEYDNAIEQFQSVLDDSSTFAPALNNLANIEFILGDFARAEQLYQNALKHSIYSHGVHLNLAMLYEMMKANPENTPADTLRYQEAAEHHIELAASLYRDSQVALNDLGYSERSPDGSREDGLIDSIKERIKKIKEYVDKCFREFKAKGKVRKVALDRSGSKGEGQLDDERWALLWWNTEVSQDGSMASN